MATRDVGWLPGTELLHSVPQAPGFIAHKVAVELTQAELQVRVNVVVPLQEPRHQLVQASQVSDFACDGECFFDQSITEPDTTSAHCYYKRFHFRDQLGLLRS
jgi:hypothetical protein